MNRKEIAETQEMTQTLLGQWVRYRQHYYRAVSEDQITAEEEKDFLELASTITQNVRRLGQRVDSRQFPFRKDEILSQLKRSISIKSLRDLPAPDKATFYKEWHISALYLSRTVGALKFIAEGYTPPAEKTKKGGKKGKKKLPLVPIIIAIVALAGVAALVMFFAG